MIYTTESVMNSGLFPVDVFVDGKKVDKAVYADTGKGIVRHYDAEPKIHKRAKRIITRTRRGKVTVVEQKTGKLCP